MAQSCCMKYHKVHIDQASLWPATYEAVALLLPSNAIWVKVGLKYYDCLNKGLLQPRILTPFTHYIIPVLHYITGVETLHMMCTVWISYEDKFYQRICTLLPYSIQPIFQLYWVSVSEVGLGILIWKSVPGNRESGLLWGSCLVWTLVLCCCHICAVLMESLVCVSEHMSVNIHRGWWKNLRKHMNQSIKEYEQSSDEPKLMYSKPYQAEAKERWNCVQC